MIWTKKEIEFLRENPKVFEQARNPRDLVDKISEFTKYFFDLSQATKMAFAWAEAKGGYGVALKFRKDKDGNTPTLGGGLSLGYRIPMSYNSRWKLEMAVGAGVYPLHYDVFHNEHNGPVYETRKKTYIGLDNILLGISYRIPFKKAQSKK